MSLVLRRVEPSDFDQIALLIYDAFDGSPRSGGDLVYAFFGRESPVGYAQAKGFCLHASSYEDVWMKVVDEDSEVEVKVLGEKGFTGETKREKRIASIGYWKVHASWSGPPKDEDHDMSYLETEAERQEAGKHLEAFMTNRYSHTSMPHVLCFIMATAKAYEGRGCGRMIMDWGLSIADTLMLPTFLEASDNGRERLYSKLGFEDRNRLVCKGDAFQFEATSMWRPVQFKSWTMKDKKEYRQDANATS